MPFRVAGPGSESMRATRPIVPSFEMMTSPICRAISGDSRYRSSVKWSQPAQSTEPETMCLPAIKNGPPSTYSSADSPRHPILALIRAWSPRRSRLQSVIPQPLEMLIEAGGGSVSFELQVPEGGAVLVDEVVVPGEGARARCQRSGLPRASRSGCGARRWPQRERRPEAWRRGSGGL